jgi:carbon starvation protein CstA
MEELIDDYVTQGYEVVSQGERSTMVRRKTWGSVAGHVFCALITVWFLFGLGNVAYALVAHFTAEQVMIKIVSPAGTPVPPAPPLAYVTVWCQLLIESIWRPSHEFCDD